LAAASSSLIHPFIAPIRSLPTRLSLLYCLRAVCHSPHLLYRRAFISAASLVHLFHRAHFISFVAFAFVRSIAASSPHSTFATPLKPFDPHQDQETDITSTLLQHAEEEGSQGAGKSKAEGEGTKWSCRWETSVDEEVCQKL
jgi:hypothetical protein